MVKVYVCVCVCGACMCVCACMWNTDFGDTKYPFVGGRDRMGDIAMQNLS